jgi:hypothetical protein
LLAIPLVLYDKDRFGGLVGRTFLATLTSGVLSGAILLLIVGWKLPVAKKWRVVLLVWALIALTSPLFGIMFLFPFTALALSMPVIVWILYNARDRYSAISPRSP